MKLTSLRFGLLLLLTAIPALAADKAKTQKLTLEDLIFDVKYLKEVLGPKTLLYQGPTKDGKTQDLGPIVTASHLTEVTKFFAFPDDGVTPKLKSSSPPVYPQNLKQGNVSGSAEFIFVIGADGNVLGLYCHRYTDRLFALAAAMSLVKWHFTPATIQGTPLPVLVDQVFEFNANDLGLQDFHRPPSPRSDSVGPLPKANNN